MRSVFLDTASVDRGDLDLTALKSSLPDWTLHPLTCHSETGAAIRHADIVVSNKVMLDRDALLAASNLKLICIAATGTNNVDLDVARQQGITVSNARSYATTSVVEHVFALLLSLRRHLQSYHNAALNGRWQNSETFCLLENPIEELAGQTLGIVGYGELGRAVASMAEAFALNVLVAQRPGGQARSGRVSLQNLLQQSDIISLHCPLADNTHNLIAAEQFALMKKSSLLINTARGGLVDETALKDALLSGQIAGAATDVLSKEPPRDGNILLDTSIPNFIVTPHVAWASTRARQALINEVTANIHAYLKGQPRNVV